MGLYSSDEQTGTTAKGPRVAAAVAALTAGLFIAGVVYIGSTIEFWTPDGLELVSEKPSVEKNGCELVVSAEVENIGENPLTVSGTSVQLRVREETAYEWPNFPGEINEIVIAPLTTETLTARIPLEDCTVPVGQLAPRNWNVIYQLEDDTPASVAFDLS